MLSMLYARATVAFIVIVWLVICYIRYHPNITVVQSYNRILVILWYDKYRWNHEYQERAYIKLFTI